MKILLVNNNTKHLRSLKKRLGYAELTIQKYRPGMEFKLEGQDLIVLSGGGGEGQEVHDKVARGKLWYDDQMRLVRSTNLPIIGICMGFEVICAAYGSKVKLLKTPVRGFQHIDLESHGQTALGQPKLKQFAHHDWGVPKIDEDQFEVWGRSETGIEIIKHKSRRIIATQFHPEVWGGSIRLRELIAAL